MQSQKISTKICVLLLATKGVSTNIVYNKLVEYFEGVNVILENKISSSRIIKRRIKNLGLIKTSGQILFQILIQPFLNSVSSGRKKELMEKYLLNDRSEERRVGK